MIASDASRWQVRAQLGVEMAYISSRLLEEIADGSVSSVMARAIAMDAVDGMMADLEQYANCLPMTSDDLRRPPGSRAGAPDHGLCGRR